MNAKNRIDYICESGKGIAENLLTESQVIHEIRETSRENRPSTYLFPLKELYLKVKFWKERQTVPIFSTEQELETLYSMTSAITTIHKMAIFSVIVIPVADFTFQYNS